MNRNRCRLASFAEALFNEMLTGESDPVRATSASANTH